jgi:exosome complex exonuclease DIS3/RRP44
MLIHRYLQYLSQATLLAGVKSGVFHQGYFNANPYNYLEVSVYLTVLSATANSDLCSFQGNVNAQAFGKPILLVGRESMNRAIDGDVVVVEGAGSRGTRSRWCGGCSNLIKSTC